MPTTLKDHYALLHLPATATHDQIKAAYRKQAFLCHPDRGGAPSRMRELNEAWSILGDPEARRAYDTERALTTRTIKPSTPSSMRTQPSPPPAPNSFLTEAIFAPIRALAFALGWLINRLLRRRPKLSRRR
ncbi:MAG: J domain-containing protein [Phycisphaerae bacterium]